MPARLTSSLDSPRAVDDEPPQRPVMELDDDTGAPPAPRIVCPAQSRWNGEACVATEVHCPPGSIRSGPACVGNVACPDKTQWSGAACERVDSATSSGSPGECTFKINSIPATEVFVDGKLLGQTPIMGLRWAAGRHVFVFSADRGKKSVTTTCKAGETKTVVVKLD